MSILFYGFTISNLDTAFISRSVLHNHIACPGPAPGGTGLWHRLPSSASVPHQAFCLTKLSWHRKDVSWSKHCQGKQVADFHTSFSRGPAHTAGLSLHSPCVPELGGPLAEFGLKRWCAHQWQSTPLNAAPSPCCCHCALQDPAVVTPCLT